MANLTKNILALNQIKSSKLILDLVNTVITFDFVMFLHHFIRGSASKLFLIPDNLKWAVFKKKPNAD